MKIKLFLIITAILASYPAYALAEPDADSVINSGNDASLLQPDYSDFSDIVFDEDVPDENEFSFDEPDSFEDTELMTDEIYLYGEPVQWDGVSQAEPPVSETDGAYEISNAAQLAWVAEQVNTQKDSVGRYVGMANKTIRLTEDIDLAGFQWIPIGNYYYCPFAGSFDGNGHTVRGLSLGDSVNGSQGGLFGCVIGSVSNLNVEAAINAARSMTGAAAKPEQNGIGIVAGTVDSRKFDYNNKDYIGTIENCSSAGSITIVNKYGEEFYIGGITGRNNGGIMINNSSTAIISAKPVDSAPNPAEAAYAGVIAGYNDGEIYNTENFGSLSAVAPITVLVHSSNPNVGMIAGGNSGYIHNIDTNTAFSGAPVQFVIRKTESAYEQDINIGGIAGKTEGGTISDCSCSILAVPSITADISDAVLNYGSISGLMSGDNSGIISDCTASMYADFNSADAVKKNIGGTVGNVTDTAATITDCSASNRISITNTNADINAGGIAGSSAGIIDSCSTDGEISVSCSARINAGGIAGISSNSLNDCVSGGSLTAVCSSPDSLSYLGGISGRAYGNIKRSAFKGTLSNTAVQAYTGGIAGYAGFLSGTSVSETPNASKLTLHKCGFDKSASVSGSYISGGIVGSAANVQVSESYSEGTVTGIPSVSDNSELGENISVAAGGIAGIASAGLEIENCFITPVLSAETSAGAVYAITGTGNRISTSYLAPVFSGAASRYPISSSEKPEGITTYGIYINKDITGADTSSEGVTIVSADEARLRSTFTEKADEKLNFDTAWIMGAYSPVLQYRYYSNSFAKVTEITENKLQFHMTLENPLPGQRAYIALYNKDNRFCGTTSAVCTEDYISSTNTKAEFVLDYSYNYWYNPKNYDENGEPKPEDEWIPSDDVPAYARAFTWDEQNGMKNLSSVHIQNLNIYFE